MEKARATVAEFFLARFEAGHQTRLRNRIVHQRNGIDYWNSLGFDFPRDGPQHRIVAPARDRGEHLNRAVVGREGIGEVCARDPTGHRGLLDAGSLEYIDNLLQLADLDPGELIDQRFELGFGLAPMRQCNQLDSALARGGGNFEGEYAVACD